LAFIIFGRIRGGGGISFGEGNCFDMRFDFSIRPISRLFITGVAVDPGRGGGDEISLAGELIIWGSSFTGVSSSFPEDANKSMLDLDLDFMSVGKELNIPLS